MRSKPAWLGAAALGSVLLLVPLAAQAHVANPDLGSFLTGFVHPLTAVEHILPMVALGVLSAQQRNVKAEWAMAVFLAALLAGLAASLLAGPALLGPVSHFTLASMVAVGCLIAAAPVLPAAVCYAVSSLLGAAHGYVNAAAMTDATNLFEFVPGLVTAATLLVTSGIVAGELALRRRSGWPRVAVRVAGSWVAAIGILIIGVAVRFGA